MRQQIGNNKYRIICIIVIAFSIAIRFQNMFTAVTHYDDIGVAASYLWDINPEVLKLGSKKLDFLWQYGWTYAPFQIFFTTLLLSNENSYFMNLVMGRFPSFIIGISNIFLIYFIVKTAFREFNSKYEVRWLPLLGVLLIGFSWENIIYSAFAAPYEIGVFAVCVILYFILREDESSAKIQYWIFVPLAMLCYMQYQIFIFIFAYYIEKILFYLKEKNKKFVIIAMLSSISCVVLTLPLLHKLISQGLLTRVTNWNVGLNDQFMLRYMGGIRGVLNFFVRNLYILYQNFFISNNNDIVSNSIVIILIILSLLGALGFKNRRCRLKRIGEFSYIIIGIFFSMIVLGKMAFSPSRHMLVIYPILIIWICNGVMVLNQLVKDKKLIEKWVGLFLILCACTFFYYYPNEWYGRKSAITQEIIEKYVDEYEVDAIVSYGYWFGLNLMHFEGFERASLGPLDEYNFQFKNEIVPGSKVLFFGSGGQLDDKGLEAFEQQAENMFFTELDLDDYIVTSVDSKDGKAGLEYGWKYFGDAGNGRRFYIVEYK